MDESILVGFSNYRRSLLLRLRYLTFALKSATPTSFLGLPLLRGAKLTTATERDLFVTLLVFVFPLGFLGCVLGFLADVDAFLVVVDFRLVVVDFFFVDRVEVRFVLFVALAVDFLLLEVRFLEDAVAFLFLDATAFFRFL